jgi:hypothetical protein
MAMLETRKVMDADAARAVVSAMPADLKDRLLVRVAEVLMGAVDDGGRLILDRDFQSSRADAAEVRRLLFDNILVSGGPDRRLLVTDRRAATATRTGTDSYDVTYAHVARIFAGVQLAAVEQLARSGYRVTVLQPDHRGAGEPETYVIEPVYESTD